VLQRASDADLIDEMGAAYRAESAAVARRLATVGELYARRAAQRVERELLCLDPFEEVAAEISAAQNISRARAGWQIRYGRQLRERLPKVAELFGSGAIDIRVVSAIIKQTENVTDESIGKLDALFAQHAHKWMKLSGPKLVDRVDLWVAKFDPDGVRVRPDIEKDRYIEVATTVPGMAGIWANIHATDAAAFDQRLDDLADTVCKGDPRTKMQRRCDAVGALAAGADRLLCECNSPDCEASVGPVPSPVVVHVLAEQATVDGEGKNPGYLPKFGVQPAEAVRKVARASCRKPLLVPEGRAAGYRPTTAQAEFVRWRDLTCRWPGCDAAAAKCDTDHTVPYPQGPTHLSNLKKYCRTHHLVKTFVTGPDGWSDRQLSDGTIIFTSPTGHEYSTRPGGALLFPALALPTGEITLPTDSQTAAPGRALAMPLRRRTREEDRQARIVRERAERAELNALAQEAKNPLLGALGNSAMDDEPPPF
jgi:hypothetical protein